MTGVELLAQKRDGAVACSAREADGLENRRLAGTAPADRDRPPSRSRCVDTRPSDLSARLSATTAVRAEVVF